MVVVLEFSDVSVKRGTKILLDHISWVVHEDERWVILGPNGAGKTTLLQLASAQIHPTSGAVDILAEQLGKVDVFELRPRIGLTSAALTKQIPQQETALNLVVTAAYAVTGRWRESYDVDDESRALQLLDEWGVADFAQRPFGSLSEGEKKRVQIARALMTDPELLLLDEPAAGLDVAGREDLLQRLTVVAEDPDSPVLIMVTHHLEEIPPGVTHALLLKEGGVVAQGRASEVLTSENLSQTFDMPLTLREANGRYTAVAHEATIRD